MSAHAKLSPSGAHRWIACPGSVRLEAGFADTTSPEAAEGTAAHALAEKCLSEQRDAEEFFDGAIVVDITPAKKELEYVPPVVVEKDVSTTMVVKRAFEDRKTMIFDITSEMVDAVSVFVDYVRDIGGEQYYERRVDISAYVPGSFGTADTTAIKGRTLYVPDFKYGAGVFVSAKNNPQGMMYALGALDEIGFMYDVDLVKIAIIQPRKENISEFEISVEDLEHWAKTVLTPAAEETRRSDAKLVPGEYQCQFCKAKGDCKALAEYALTTAFEGFEDISEPGELRDADLMTNEELAAVHPRLKLAKSWLENALLAIGRRMHEGEDMPGLKLVEGVGRRSWIDDEKAIKALGRKVGLANAFNRKIIGIGDAEKLLGKEDPTIAKHTAAPPGKPTVVPESDPRPAIDPFDGFDDIDEI